MCEIWYFKLKTTNNWIKRQYCKGSRIGDSNRGIYDKEMEHKYNELEKKDEELQKTRAKIILLQNEVESFLKESCLMKDTSIVVEEDLYFHMVNVILERKLQAEGKNGHRQTESADTWKGLEKMQENIEQLKMKNNESLSKDSQ
ncbi:hypothetical protein ZYGR_0P01700 [Zygosaccharomyces rouxii]|uniref:ZYRO0E04334p n=2 Tax=Zygosaccharomyces rouxii TaxID=4956 RepID=C5E4A7_ZYGRC|nr:uncharacterized protein ZYRO0E04334g [Zygosaccharomyces rouxii]KAH9198275.1 hypothetical protein LQ764DRAFT_156537 [Zygosaccharomyces rouxii]GAV49526.1 hypothetical protein ZYGR_0P01700 [Zygosaccharomyces rouxii]CAR30868.1 ZYRO0E04334p [Zygosaccharomyces rouxii]